MKIGVLKETRPGECRVALTPEVFKLLLKKGFQVVVEAQAGLASAFSDQSYQDSGAQVLPRARVFAEARLFLKVNAFTQEEVLEMPSGAS